MTYFGNVNPDLLEIVPLTARRVLELGCGEGVLAAAYRSRNPQAHYTAVEVHGPSAEKAAAQVDRLLRADFESMDDAEVTGGTLFDTIVMGDVLEHMSDPDRVLARLRGLLADDGHLAISVPNVAHWTALFHLINGRWPSQDSGLFDRTHLRFFTLQSLTEALTRAGFRLIKGRPRQFLLDQTMAEKWIPPLADLAEKMGVNRQEFLRRSSALQYVVLAQKAERPVRSQMHVRVATFAPTLMDARTRLPADYLRSAPELFVSHAVKDHALPSVPIQAPKVLIVQRHVPDGQEEWAARLAQAIRAGWVVVSEWDDHPDLIAQATNRTDAEMMWTTIAAAHAVQTSTEPLAEAFRARNPEVMPFANAAFTLMPFRETRGEPPRIFFGAANRQGFSVPVAQSLGPMLERHPDVAFEVVHDRAFFDALPTSAKTFHPTLPYADYLNVMGKCDIALLPLEGREAERFKSDIKYVEAGSRGLAVIASPSVYGASVRDGVTGLIAADLADWAPALERLLVDPDLHQTLARAAWKEVRDDRMFASQVEARRAWYADLWQRRAELEADLIARVPLLARALGR
jgi:SAM-dependent methyltransferase